MTATFTPGIYIMAGGGLRVCGASSLSAPNVLIYNTNDPTSPTGYGALDQFELMTTGSVNIGLPADGPYEGLTYWQDSSLALDAADSCNNRNNTSAPTQAQINTYDIALMSAASTGTNGRSARSQARSMPLRTGPTSSRPSAARRTSRCSAPAS